MAFETINLGTQPAGTGGDTARSAFEKVNKNYITAAVLASAMSQAQFEAIRAQNNEEYAASGFVHFGKGYDTGNSNGVVINEGMFARYSSATYANSLYLGTKFTSTSKVGSSKYDEPHINIAGCVTKLSLLSSSDINLLNRVKLPQSPDGTVTYDSATGDIVKHADSATAFAAETTTNKVVTDRVDMWGFESWLEEVTVTNPYVYPNGLIQSLAATMDSIATTASNRPDTYYAWFDGDTISKGKGVNYFTLTDAQKRKVLANHKNKLYFLDDGRLVQWRVRGRSFAGAGNGDWENTSSVSLAGVGANISYSLLNTATAQGVLDYVAPYRTTEPAVWYNSDFGGNTETGAFRAGLGQTPSTAVAINGECYFLVCGTVNRLNSGAYHPSFNPSGAAALSASSGDLSSPKYWQTSDAVQVTSVLECFTKKTTNSTFIGNIGSDSKIRPDGRFYDAIYADGQGGVCRDMRYSANHTTQVDFAEADLKVKNGTYRGFEKRVFTRVVNQIGTTVVLANTVDIPKNAIPYTPVIGEYLYAYDSVIGGYVRRKITNVVSDGSGTVWWLGLNTPINRVVNSLVMIEQSINNSVGGSFLQTDVIGDPAKILQVAALKDGWSGSWIPKIPTGSYIEFPLTRKGVDTGITVTETTNNGSSWSSAVTTYDSVKNSRNTGHLVTSVLLYQYQAFAKQTEPTVNTAVYGMNIGLGGMWQYGGFYNPNWGSLFVESLLSKVSTSSSGGGGGSALSLISTTLRPFEFFLNAGSGIDSHYHYPIEKPAPTNNSIGCKALNYNTKTNQQAGINYAATELVWESGDLTGAVGTAAYSYFSGIRYRITTGAGDQLLRCVTAVSLTFTVSMRRRADGAFINSQDVVCFIPEQSSLGSWGDDSEIHIVNNENTLTDLNGTAVKVVTHKLKEPVGWIKNTI
jgi:hypothetical protein